MDLFDIRQKINQHFLILRIMYTPKQPLPNATLSLVLGICSVVFGCFALGLIFGIIGLVLSSKSKKLYEQNPELYEGYGTANAGFVLSIIGLVMGAISMLYFIFWILFLGGSLFTLMQTTHTY